MAYSVDVAKILTEQVVKFASLNRHQLAGQVANLDFWEGEVRHALGVIDGHRPRFEAMKGAQVGHTSARGTVEYDLNDPVHTRQGVAPPRGIPDSDLGDARRALCDATYRFLVRCFREGLVDEERLRGTCGRLGIGIEAGDLRARG